jgi:hypothetical protein
MDREPDNRIRRRRSNSRGNRKTSRSRSRSRTRGENFRPRRRSSSRERGRRGNEIDYYKPKYSREEVELFIGNINEAESTDEMLRDFLNLAMKESGLFPKDGPDALVNCKITNRYAFIEFCDPETCTKGLSLNNIPFMGTLLRICRPLKYAGNIKEGKTWQELTGDTFVPPTASVAGGSTHLVSENKRGGGGGGTSLYFRYNLATKSLFEIFIGGVSDDMTNDALRDFLGVSLQKLGIASTGIDNPIVDVKISGNKFAFIACKTPEDASNLLNLNGVLFGNHSLKLERPSKFEGGIPGIGFYAWNDLLSMWLSGELKLLTAGNTPTRILKIKNMVTLSEVMEDDYYIDVLQDIRNEFSQYGLVKSIVIPRQNNTGNSAESESPIFMEMNSITDAKNAVVNVKGRIFNDRYLDIKFYPEENFKMYDYCYEEPLLIMTASHGPVYKEQVITAEALSKL